MRWIAVFGISGALVFFLALSLLSAHMIDLYHQYNPIDYLTSSITHHGQHKSHEVGGSTLEVEDKIVVMAAMEEEDTAWVAEELPE